jgi:hypothetical protein
LLTVSNACVERNNFAPVEFEEIKPSSRAMTERRTFNTPLREPLNPIIYQSLRAIDWHNTQYFLTMDQWHLEKAAIIRRYVTELKAWIYEQEEAMESVGESLGS